MADENVFQHGHTGEEADILEGTCDAEIDDLIRLLAFDGGAVQDDIPFGHLIHAGDQVENGGLAGAVWPDDAEDLPFVYMEGHIGNSGEAAELFHYIFHFEQHQFFPPSTAFLLNFLEIHFTAS